MLAYNKILKGIYNCHNLDPTFTNDKTTHTTKLIMFRIKLRASVIGRQTYNNEMGISGNVISKYNSQICFDTLHFDVAKKQMRNGDFPKILTGLHIHMCLHVNDAVSYYQEN